jgi:hypothetical protein
LVLILLDALDYGKLVDSAASVTCPAHFYQGLVQHYGAPLFSFFVVFWNNLAGFCCQVTCCLYVAQRKLNFRPE